jgi:predicted dehydrogenase
LENQVFAPTVTRGKDLIWARAARVTGRPYLVRAAEEHSGPHSPWFWQGNLQGGGVLNDMMCHSVEAARYLLTDPKKSRSSLKPVKVQATIASLKWSKEKYAKELTQLSPEIDYTNHPSEDYAHATITFKDEDNNSLIAELTTSWCFVGAGLRLSFEMLGPEYSMKANTLSSGLDVFLSRRIQSSQGEDMVEKQNAEQGLMPVVPDEESTYGYTAENRHMVESFLLGQKPLLTFEDGVEVVKILMACYYSAQEERTINFDEAGLDEFIPDVAKGTWKPL